MDNLELLSEAPNPLGIQLKKYISYYQGNKRILNELVEIFTEITEFQTFLDQLDSKMDEIDIWYQQQEELIQEHKVEITYSGITILCSDAEIRAGEITQQLMHLNPGYDFYIGLSWQEHYMNIRSNKAKYPIADKIAHHFQGGGHEERAGFPIPSEYGNNLENNQKMESIPQSLIDEILKQLSFEVQALETISVN